MYNEDNDNKHKRTYCQYEPFHTFLHINWLCYSLLPVAILKKDGKIILAILYI